MNYLQHLLYNFQPYHTEEYAIKKDMIRFLSDYPQCLSREYPLGHITVSAMIINVDKTKLLACYHTRYNEWSPIGGHCDGNTDIKKVIENEIQEEIGIPNDIFKLDISHSLISIDQCTYQCRTKKIIHYDMCFMVHLKEDIVKIRLNDEIQHTKWFDLSEHMTHQNDKKYYIPQYMIKYYESLQVHLNKK